MGEWQIVGGAAAGGFVTEFPGAKGRRFVARLTDPSEVSFTLDGRLPEATVIDELATDLHVLWQESGLVHRLYRGRAGTTGDTIDVDTHTVNITSLDYRALLRRRRLYSTSTLVYTGVDEAEIARQLIQQTQTRTGGNLGISMGRGNPAGITTSVTFSAGDSIGEKIDTLAQTINGFDWDITPTSASALALDVWYPQRGSSQGVVLEFGGMVSKATRTVDSSAYANAIRESGADALVAQEREAADLAVRAEGRWDAVFGDTTIVDQASLNSRADWQLAQSEALTPTYTLTLKPGTWLGPQHIWLGDTVRVVIMSGRLAVDTTQRVHEISFTLSDDDSTGDTTTVEVTTGGPRLDYRRRPIDTQRRLTNLERR